MCLHLVCPLRHPTTLLVSSPCAAVVTAARVNGFDVEDELSCIHAACGLPGTPGSLSREHAEVYGGVWDNTRSASKPITLEHVRWDHWVKQVHGLPVHPCHLGYHIEKVPPDGIMAGCEVSHRECGQPHLVSPCITDAAIRLVCRLAAWDELMNVGSEGWCSRPQVHAQMIGELCIAQLLRVCRVGRDEGVGDTVFRHPCLAAWVLRR